MRFALLFFLTACTNKEGDSAGDEEVIFGAYDGAIDVREGSSAPLHIDAEIVFFEGPSGIIGSALELEGSDEPVTFETTLSGGEITLIVPWETGTIVGTGPMEGGFADPPAELEGDLTGPTADDTGDWLFQLAPALLPAVPYACFAACSYSGYSDASCNRTCGTNN